MMEQLRELLQLKGLVLTEDTYQQIEKYHALLLAWNTKIDLTNVPEEEMALVHYADSLLPLLQPTLFPFGASLIDVGTGAGFPGLMLAIARKDMRVCLLDSLKKRCVFLEVVQEELGLNNVRVLHARAEDAARGAERERYDLAVARAVAPLNVLCEYLMPFVKTGGKALCWKGPQVKEEMACGARAAEIVGGQLGDLLPLSLPGREHYVQVIHKKAPAPRIYPRKAGTPAKTPLGL